MLLSEKLTLLIILMTTIFLVFSGEIELEIFIVLIVIGVIILREVIESFAPIDLKDRMNFFIYIGFLIVILIVINKAVNVIEHLNK